LTTSFELVELLDDLDTDASDTLKKLKGQWHDSEAQPILQKIESLIDDFDFEKASEHLEDLTQLLNRS